VVTGFLLANLDQFGKMVGFGTLNCCKKWRNGLIGFLAVGRKNSGKIFGSAISYSNLFFIILLKNRKLSSKKVSTTGNLELGFFQLQTVTLPYFLI
jgi:hypothetical protein